MANRLVPDRLWGRFEQVVPKAPTRPRGGGRRRYGDRQAMAVIFFVVTHRVHVGAGPAGVRTIWGDGSPAVHGVEPTARVGQTALPRPGRAGFQGRVGQTGVRR